MPGTYVSPHALVIIAGQALGKALDAAVQYYRGHALAPSTKRAYMTHLKTYLEFCKIMGCQPLSVNNATLCRYAAYLSNRLKFNSIKKYLNILRVMHLEAGLQNPVQNNYVLNSLLKGVQRVHGSMPARKFPITLDILGKIKCILDMNQPFDIVFWAACLVAFYGLLRKSNLLPSSQAAFDPAVHLCRGDLHKAPQGLAIRIKWSKTVQFKERYYFLPMPLMTGQALCPATALVNALMLNACATKESPLLALPLNRPLTQAQFLKKLHQSLESIGLPSREYSGHSFRRGGATHLFQRGIPGELIQVMGDWRSDAYKSYLEIDLSTKFNLLQGQSSYTKP